MSSVIRFVPLGLKVILPIVTVVASIGVARWLIATKPAPAEQAVGSEVPPVTAVRVEKRAVCFPIRSQGSVQPRTESTLVARVAGRLEWVADCFDESGFFRKGDELVRIDRRDYEVRIRRLEAALAAADAERREAEHRRDRVIKLQSRSVVSEAEIDQANALFEMATARAEELQAQLEEANNALEDTVVRAPFDGCIREKLADVGRYVTPGTPLATCFATDAVEVRLPVTDEEFAFLDLRLGETLEPGTGPEVVLEARFAGELRRWTGTIVRSEAMVDCRSRMVYLVASVPRPYEPTGPSGGQPLAVGMFVAATIRCTPVPDGVVLPEACVSPGGELFVIGSTSALERREVRVLRREGNRVVVRGDLNDGELVCATRLEHAIPGMQVDVVETVAPESGAFGQGGLVDLSAGATLAAGQLDDPSLKD